MTKQKRETLIEISDVTSFEELQEMSNFKPGLMPYNNEFPWEIQLPKHHYGYS